MYLSRLKLDTLKRATRELRVNPYLLHQAVFRAFPDQCDGGPGRLLYRLDIDHQGNTSLLVQSEKEPAWSKADYLQSCCEELPEYREYKPAFQRGQSFYFTLRANPTVKRATEEKPDVTKRQGLLRDEDQLKWLQRKAEAGGFSVIACQTISEGIIQNERGKEEKGKIRHYAVRFGGTLQVINPDLFLAAIQDGIGPAKGFGFGLLSIAPVKD